MKKKRRGFDLVRKDVSGGGENAPEKARAGDVNEEAGELARIQTRKAMRTSDGRVVSLEAEGIHVWMFQIEAINRIFLVNQLEEEGYAPLTFKMLTELPEKLKTARKPPSLVIVAAQAVGQQGPFFRRQLWPLLEKHGIPCLLFGVKPEQQKVFSSWFQGHMVEGADMDQVVRSVRKLIGPGLRR